MSEHQPRTRKGDATSTSDPIEIVVEQKLREEIAATRRSLDAADTTTFDLQAKYDKAVKKVDRPSAKQVDVDAADRLHRQLTNAQGRGLALSERLQVLRSEGELERRVNHQLAVTERIGKMATRAKSNGKVNAKDQGVPSAYLSESGSFRPGMDARLKSDLVNTVLDLPAKGALHTFSKDEAAKLLKARSWEGYVDRKREVLANKSVKKTTKVASKTQAARKTAAAKKSAPAKGDLAKAQVVPMPKPTTTKRSRSRSSRAKA